MNLERKLELLQRYDFQNFRSRFAAIDIMKVRFEGGKLSPQDVREISETLGDIYSWAQERYNRVDFEELERELKTPEDRKDFETLFKTRDLLTQFKQAVEKFSAYCQERNYDVPQNPEEFSALYRICIEIGKADKYQGIPYRLRKQRLEAELGTEPSPPKM